jgi:sorting nexin-29
LKRYKSPGSELIPTKLIQARGEILYSKIHKLIISILNKAKFPDQRNESIIVPIHKKDDKIDCSNYRGMSLLSISYNILTNILFTKLSPYIDEIIRDRQCGFRRNRSNSGQIFCILQLLEKKWEYNETVRQLFVNLKKAYDSFKREVLYNILIECGVPMEIVRLIKMC